MQNDNEDSSLEITKKAAADSTLAVSGAEHEDPEVIDAEMEEKYNKAIIFMKSLKCMTPCKDKVKMYKDAAQMFLDLSGYRESEDYAKKCKKRAKKTKEEINQNFYDKALEYKNNAKSLEDYEKAAENFRKAKGHQDAEENAQECDRQKDNLEKKLAHKSLLKYGVTILCAAAIIFCFMAPAAKYLIANIEMTVGSYAPAIGLYDKLGTYRDSEQKLTESRYRYGLRLESRKDYKNAAKFFTAAGGYKDSELKAMTAEKQVLMNCKIGATVKIAGCNWIILDKTENQALLLKKSAITIKTKKDTNKKSSSTGMPYNDSLMKVTWETSSIRSYLNGKFLTDTFSKKEIDNIISSDVKNEDNIAYGTDAGNDTKDKVFLLSITEVNKYGKEIPKLKTNTWLRTPGNSQESAAFLSVSGNVMDYGYAVNGTDFSVKPAIWFNLK